MVVALGMAVAVTDNDAVRRPFDRGDARSKARF